MNQIVELNAAETAEVEGGIVFLIALAIVDAAAIGAGARAIYNAFK